MVTGWSQCEQFRVAVGGRSLEAGGVERSACGRRASAGWAGWRWSPGVRCAVGRVRSRVGVRRPCGSTASSGSGGCSDGRRTRPGRWGIRGRPRAVPRVGSQPGRRERSRSGGCRAGGECGPEVGHSRATAVSRSGGRTREAAHHLFSAMPAAHATLVRLSSASQPLQWTWSAKRVSVRREARDRRGHRCAAPNREASLKEAPGRPDCGPTLRAPSTRGGGWVRRCWCPG
jgi:hypothetical protein